jgi:hypothetical protein
MPDVQINRVLDRQGRMLVLLPYPGAGWSASHYPKAVEELRRQVQEGKGSSYELRQAIIAAKPDRLEDFAEYVRATVGHDHARVAHYEILNEPLYTHYALPNTAQGYAYKVSDYIDVLRTAYRAAKAVDPACTVIGGIACPPEAGWVGRFIEQGGLEWCDVMNYHMYPTRRRPETVEPALQEHCRQMRNRGQVRPIWVTEFGLYAEDDPVTLPAHAGDLTMDDAMRPSERIAAADLVQWAAVMFAHGVRKAFYHAGVCQGYHQASIGNIFYEYGGLPRKMLPAVAVLARLLGPEFQFVRKWDKPAWLSAYEFRSRGRPLVILWTRKPDAPPLDVPQGFRAVDLMGNAIDGRRITVGEEPVYLVGG